MRDCLSILIAPDSFKGSLSAAKVSGVLYNRFIKSDLLLKVKQIPLADGGEGSLEAIKQSKNFESIKHCVFNHYFKEIEAEYLIDKTDNTAYIELAQASGINSVSGRTDIMNATTYGTGQQIKHAIENRASKIILFIGGSATNDAGLGILEACGYQFFNSVGKKIKPVPVNLGDITKIDDTNSIFKKINTEILIAADVTNPFYGHNGAAYVYAPQKGAKPEDVKQLDAGLRHFAKLVLDGYRIDLQDVKGAGAAGGVGGGLYAFAGAKIISGSDLIFDILDIEEKIKKADIVISGEGKIDKQSLNNKLLYSISMLTKKHQKQLWAICGYFDGDEKLKQDLALNRVFSLSKTKEEIPIAMLDVKKRLSLVADEIVKSLLYV